MSDFNPSYLEAKKIVDARSRNRQVWGRFLKELQGNFKPAVILDLGAGTGAFFELILKETNIRDCEYIPLDADGQLLRNLVDTQDQRLLEKRNIRIQPVEDRLESFLEHNRLQYDLVLTNAFLDLVNLDAVADRLFSIVAPSGILYSTLLFDGVTSFLPELDPTLDRRVEALYHGSMAHQDRSGSRAGRILMSRLMQSDLEILEAGSSDWAILPKNRGYDSADRQLLGAILDFHQDVLERDGSGTGEIGFFREWLTQRRNQLAAGQLALLTHQWDVLAKK